MREVKAEVKACDILEVEIKRASGERIRLAPVTDLITNTGLNRLAGLFCGVYTTPFKYLAMGTSTVTEQNTDTALGAEVTRALASVTLTTTNVTNDTAQLECEFTMASAVTIAEFGIFDASSGGNMYARRTRTPIPLNSGDTIHPIWKIVFSR